jgi:hypothetical protein
MRVNMDSSIATDPAFRLVAEDLGVDRKAIIGACYLVWLACYERRSKRLSKREANAVAELERFAEVMIEHGLALDPGDGGVEFRGVEKRIAFLKSQAERGAKGGTSRGKNDSSKRLANAKQTLAGKNTTAQAYSPSPSPSPSPDRSLSVATPGGASTEPEKKKRGPSGNPPPHWACEAAEALVETVRAHWPAEPVLRKEGTTAVWARELDRLSRIDKAGEVEIRESVAWLAEHGADEFVPEVRSAKALREKWGRVQSARMRSERPIRAVRDAEAVAAAWDRAAENEALWRANRAKGGGQ